MRRTIFFHSANFQSATACIAVFQISIVSMANGQAIAAEAENKAEAEAGKHVAQSYRLMKAGEDDQALVEINKAVKLSGGAFAYRQKAQILADLGKPREALIEAKKSVLLDPKNPDIHSLMGSILHSLKLNSAALDEYNIAIDLNPKERGFRIGRSKLFEENHQYDKAVIDLTVAIDNTDAHNRSKLLERRGNFYVVLKDYQKAVADYTAALKSSYGRSELLRLRATAYEKLGNHAAAQKDLEGASSMDEAFEPPSTLGENK